MSEKILAKIYFEFHMKGANVSASLLYMGSIPILSFLDPTSFDELFGCCLVFLGSSLWTGQVAYGFLLLRFFRMSMILSSSFVSVLSDGFASGGAWRRLGCLQS